MLFKNTVTQIVLCKSSEKIHAYVYKKSQPDYCHVKLRTTVDGKGLIAVAAPFAIPNLAKAGIKSVLLILLAIESNPEVSF